uniref:Uncharacterized protein n=1 Tax=Hyaloperonospora arabidopsidis (strain Emoy2) TaxID=559515 RepID=M4BWI9_HYAAE
MARVTGVERQARAAAMWWEVAKVHLHTSYLAFKRASRRKSKSGYRQRINRLEKKLSEAAVVPPVVISGSAGAGDMACWETVTSIRRAISDFRARWQALKLRSLFRSHTHHLGHSARDFFRRVSNKFLDNTVLSLGDSSTHGSVRYRRLPEVMREKWQGVMQQLAAGPDLIDGFVAALPSRAGVEGLEGLCDHVT